MLSDKGRAAYAVGKERVHLADSVVGAAAGDMLGNHRVRGEGCARLFQGMRVFESDQRGTVSHTRQDPKSASARLMVQYPHDLFPAGISNLEILLVWQLGFIGEG